MPSLLDQGASLLALGSGEYQLEQGLEELRRRYPKQVGIYIGYSDEFAHKVYAASDFFLMPSLFEPCGIGQLIAQRYGAIPIVRDTGGLHDTINDYLGGEAGESDGIKFCHYNVEGLAYASKLAMKLYADEATFHALQHNAMKKDNSWKKSANKYLSLYKGLLKE